MENYKEGKPVYNIQIDSKETATYMMGLENKITKFMKGQKLWTRKINFLESWTQRNEYKNMEIDTTRASENKLLKTLKFC